MSGGDVYVLCPTEDSDLRIEQPDPVARGLLSALDGTRTVPELEAEFGGGRVGEALAVLADAELIDDAADESGSPRAPAPATTGSSATSASSAARGSRRPSTSAACTTRAS